jgi:hypothetical protein
MDGSTTPLVVEIAREFMTLLQSGGQPWVRGFFRFRSEENSFGSNASYVFGEHVFLISAMRNKVFYERTNELGRRLIESFDRTRGLFLIVVKSDFSYEIKFEWDDLNKWEIGKIDGGTGLPSGI